ncbi:hypothetical protein AB0N65_12440 [Paenarthrobacter sp. NPDC089322]|uniref:hypothetical protein n=1 Tax=Paenarthrobacter sp. NPDC089322 TaxID=3155065 RepID=UPI003434DEBD
MKIQWTRNDYGRSGLLAIAEDGDTQPPIETFYVDYLIETVDQDRLAIAAALVFGPYTDTRLVFENPVSSGVARAIENLYPDKAIRVEPVSYSENHSPHGDSLLHVNSHYRDTNFTNHVGQQRQVRVTFQPTDRSSGGLLTMDSLDVACNSWLHAELRPDAHGDVLCTIAGGILLSSDLSAAGIAICDTSSQEGSPVYSRATRLLESVGLSLVLNDCGAH